jgi:hypothetical protein
VGSRLYSSGRSNPTSNRASEFARRLFDSRTRRQRYEWGAGRRSTQARDAPWFERNAETYAPKLGANSATACNAHTAANYSAINYSAAVNARSDAQAVGRSITRAEHNVAADQRAAHDAGPADLHPDPGG